MKNTARKILLTTLAGAGLCLLASSARALPVTIDTSDYGVGTVINGTPSSPTVEQQFVDLLIDIWNGAKPAGPYPFGNGSNTKQDTLSTLAGSLVPGSLTSATGTGNDSGTFTSDDNKATLTLPSGGAQYILTKWGGGDILFYVGGLAGGTMVTVVNDQIDPGNSFTGLSHFEFFGVTVPDGGSTLVLLGTALLGVAWARNKFARS